METVLYRSWLLIQQEANSPLQELVEGFGVGGQIGSLGARILVSLGIRDGIGFIRTPDPHRLVGEMRKAGSVEAVSLAPIQDLAVLHRQVFFWYARHFQVIWYGAEPHQHREDNPYYRRFVRLEFLHSSPQADLDNRDATEVCQGELEAEEPLLILQPERFEVEKRKFELACVHRGKPLRGINGAFLPPVRMTAGTSYFSPERRHLREQLHLLFDTHTSTSLPAAVAIWRLMDDPLLRDIFLDGGSLQVIEGDAGATSVRLAFFAQAEEKQPSIDWLRKTTFLTPDELPFLEEWAKKLGHVLRQDIQEMCTGHVALAEAQRPLTWTVSPRPTFDHGGPAAGTWQCLQSLKERLSDHDRKAAVAFDDFVLWPSRARHQGNPDHDQAEHLFACNAFRCPSSEELDPSWRRAMVALVQESAAHGLHEPADRLQSWQHPALSLTTCADGTLILYHPASADADDLCYWRLVLPLGTRFTSRPHVTVQTGTIDVIEASIIGGLRIIDPSFGVMAFDWKHSLHVTGPYLTIAPLRGITPRGQLVRIAPHSPLGVKLPEECQCVDLWIWVKPHQWEHKNPEDRFECMVTSADAVASIHPNTYDDRLYLGRYQYTPNALELLERPFPHCLAGVQPHDAGWEVWTRPFKETLQEQCLALEKRVARDPRMLPAWNEMLLLSTDWPSEPIFCLAQRVERVRRLMTWGSSSSPLLPEPRLGRAAWSMLETTGESLPGQLALLLPTPAAGLCVEGLQPAMLQQLLAPIRLRVPLREFQTWSTALTHGALDQDYPLVVNALRERAAATKLDVWSRAVGLLTLLALKAAGMEPSAELVAAYARRQRTPKRALARTLQRLWRVEARRAPAGPLGFVQLGILAAQLPMQDLAVSKALQRYLSAVSSRQLSPFSGHSPRITHFLARWLSPGIADKTSAPVWSAKSCRENSKEQPTSNIRIVIAGPQGSGKSTLVQSWEDSRASAHVPWDLRLDPWESTAEPTEGDAVTYRHGVVRSARGTWGLEILECPTSQQLLWLEERLVPCDLLIILLDPATLDRRLPPGDLLDRLSELAKRVWIKGHCSFVALCFSKADEYGTADPKSLRLFGGNLREATATALRVDWRREARRQGRQQRLDPAWIKTRGIVLEQTRPLWEQFKRHYTRGGLNAYFVAPASLDPCLASPPHRGTWHPLEDFWAVFQGGANV